MTDCELPPITEVQRLRLEPGDRLVIKLDATIISEQEGVAVTQRIRARLGLPDNFPLLLIGKGSSVQVVSS